LKIAQLQRYPAYKDSGVEWIGEIPVRWEVTRLGTRFKERKTKVSDKDYAPLSVTKNGVLPQLLTAAKTNDGDNRKLVKKGDFVINSRSDRKGSSGISLQNGSVSLINIVIEPLVIHPAYCNYLLKGYAFIEEFYRIGHGIVADLWTTRYDEMKNIKISIPSLPEQTAIANFLDEKCSKIDRAVAQKKKLVELLKERKQIVIQNAVTKGLNPNAKMKDSGVEWIGEIPEGWKVSKAKYYSEIFVPERTKPNLNEDKNGVPWVTTEHLIDDYLSIDRINFKVNSNDIRKAGSRIIKAGSVLATCVGNFGIASINEFDCIINQQIQGFTKLRVVPEFLLRMVRLSKEYFSNNSTMTTIKYVNKETFGDLPIVLPPLSEQTTIVAHIEKETAKIDKAITLQQNQIEKLKEYKAILINNAVTGKIKVC